VPTRSGLIKKKYKGYQLLFKDYKTLGINNQETALKKIREVGKKGKPLADPNLWTAVGQIAILKMQVQNYIDDPGNNKRGWYYSPWGEYSGANQYGWIRHLKFKTAVEFYVKNNPGKTEEDLIKHCRPFIHNMRKENQDGKAVYARWLAGEVFGD